MEGIAQRVGGGDGLCHADLRIRTQLRTVDDARGPQPRVVAQAANTCVEPAAQLVVLQDERRWRSGVREAGAAQFSGRGVHRGCEPASERTSEQVANARSNPKSTSNC